MLNRVLLAVLALAVAAVLALTFIPRGTKSGPGSKPEAAVGHPAPAFRLRGADGRTMSLADLRGKVVLVNFWATWCVPCRQEMPQLGRWYRRDRARGLTVLGVDKQDPVSDVRSFLRALGIPYPVVLDGTGWVSSAYRAFALPVSYVIDRNGTIRAIRYGAVDAAFWHKHVMTMVRGRA